MKEIPTFLGVTLLCLMLAACGSSTAGNEEIAPTQSEITPPLDVSPAVTAPAAQAPIAEESPTAIIAATQTPPLLECGENTPITEYAGHLLVDIERTESAQPDSAQLVRADQDVTTPVGVGSVLEHGDSLKVADGATATILCDTTLQVMRIASPGDALASTCPAPNGSLTVDDLRIETVRGPGLDSPFIISPLTPNITTIPRVVRWNHTGVESYTFCFRQGNEDIHCEEEIRPTIVEPSASATVPPLPTRQIAEYELINPPQLEPGTYILAMLAFDAESGTPQEDMRRFTLLDDQSAEVVNVMQTAEKARTNLAERGLSAEVQTLAAAHVHIAEGMHDTALKLLEPLTSSQDTDLRLSALMLTALLYEQSDLSYAAAESYQAALDVAQTHHPTEIRRLAAIHFGYGRVWLSFGHNYIPQAHPHFTVAREHYMQLAETDRVCQIDSELEGIDNE